MASPRRWATVRKATAHGVELVRGAEVKEITASDVVFVLADGEPHTVPADDVIIAGQVTTGPPLADALPPRGLQVHVIGDATHVGYLHGPLPSSSSFPPPLSALPPTTPPPPPHPP